MIKCKKCGGIIPDNSVFCQHCGEKVVIQAPKVVKYQGKVPSEVQNESPIEVPKKKKKKWPLFLIIGLVIVALAIILLLKVFSAEQDVSVQTQAMAFSALQKWVKENAYNPEEEVSCYETVMQDEKGEITFSITSYDGGEPSAKILYATLKVNPFDSLDGLCSSTFYFEYETFSCMSLLQMFSDGDNLIGKNTEVYAPDFGKKRFEFTENEGFGSSQSAAEALSEEMLMETLYFLDEVFDKINEQEGTKYSIRSLGFDLP